VKWTDVAKWPILFNVITKLVTP